MLFMISLSTDLLIVGSLLCSQLCIIMYQLLQLLHAKHSAPMNWSKHAELFNITFSFKYVGILFRFAPLRSIEHKINLHYNLIYLYH